MSRRVSLIVPQNPSERLVEAAAAVAEGGGGAAEDAVKPSLLNKKDNISQRTALHWAIEHGNLTAANILLQLGARCDELDQCGKTPLMLAASKGLSELVVDLIERKASLDAVDRSKGNTVLIETLAEGGVFTDGHAAVVTKLLESKADVNVADKSQKTALHHICRTYVLKDHRSRIVRALLEANADVNALDESGHSPLKSAASYLYFDTVQLLLQHKAQVNEVAGESALLYDAVSHFAKGHCVAEAVVQLLMQHGAAKELNKLVLNSYTCHRVSALRHAIFMGSLPIVRLFLQAGADPNLGDQSCLLLALLQFNDDKEEIYVNQALVKMLLFAGVDASVATSEAISQRAAWLNPIDCYQVGLLEQGQLLEKRNALLKRAMDSLKKLQQNVAERLRAVKRCQQEAVTEQLMKSIKLSHWEAVDWLLVNRLDWLTQADFMAAIELAGNQYNQDLVNRLGELQTQRMAGEDELAGGGGAAAAGGGGAAAAGGGGAAAADGDANALPKHTSTLLVCTSRVYEQRACKTLRFK